jgi:hypothetical protein
MGNLVFQATLGGQVNLVGPNTASTFNLNVPAIAGTLITSGDSATVTNTMLAGSIANAKLLNSSITVGSTAIALGASATTVAGLTLTSPTLTTPVLGTPASGTLTNCTGLPTSGLTGSISEANGGTGTTTGYYGFKNRIINGGMTIAQRGTGSTSVQTSTTYASCDRWASYATQNSKYTVQQSSTAPTGFSNSLLATSSAATSLNASDYYLFTQSIEGYNFADLGFGTANAKTVTLSFQVYSSLTGTFGGSLANYAGNRSYPFTYTISSANTWTTASVTIPGDTTGTWVGASNAGAVVLYFGLGVGTSYSGTAGAWAAANYLSATGATSVVGTNGATFYITGVQLEKGSTATSFDYRPYGTELALCQRYCYKIATSGGYSTYATTGMFISTTRVDFPILFPTYMRASPTGTYTAANTYLPSSAGTDFTPSAVASVAGSASAQAITVTFTVSGATAGRAATLTDLNSTASNMIFSAEL